MDYRDFFLQDGKKILIADSVSVGNTIRRKTNVLDGVDTKDVTTFSAYDIAKELVVAYMSYEYPDREILFLEKDSAAYYLDEVIADNRPEFIPLKSLTIATVTRIYNTLADIRSFPKTPEYEKDANDDTTKVYQVKKLIDAYEEKLISENLYDRPLVFRDAIKILKSDDFDNDRGNSLLLNIYLPWINNCIFGDLTTNKRNGIEDEFISLLSEIATSRYGASHYEVSFLPYDSIEESKNNLKWDFFKAYGQVNEISHVIKLILGEAKGEFDKYNLFYTSADYENFIIGLFDLAHIPYVFEDGFHAKNTSIGQLMLAILDFVDSDFELEKLRPVIQNKSLTYNLSLKDTRGINPGYGYNSALNSGIGWGLDRYKAYLSTTEVKASIAAYEKLICSSKKENDGSDNELICGEENTASDELSKEELQQINKGCFATFLSRLIDIFDENNSIATVYKKLISFVSDYTYSKSTERLEVMEPLKLQCKVFERLSGKRCVTVNDKVSYIREYLDKLTVTKKTGDVAVCIRSIGGFKVLERENNFFIGLGAKQFAINNTESAVMSDTEMLKYLSGNNLPLASEKNVNRQKQFKNTIFSLKKGSIHIGYSNYNTVDLRENSPSVIYMELLGKDKDGDAISYDYINGDITIDLDEFIGSIDGFIDEKKSKENEEALEDANHEALMSASELQDLLKCPLIYYYKCIKNLKIPNKRTKNGHEWLPPMDRGNLFHRVAEEYMRLAMPPAAIISDKVDDALFERIWKEKVNQMEAEVPWTSDVIKKKEIEEYREVTYAYLEHMHLSWSADYAEGMKWEIIGCELDFDAQDNIIVDDDGADISYKYKDETDGLEHEKIYQSSPYPYRIHFRRGQIDRLDGYVDESGRLMLRIVDYKTGRLESKLEEISDLIQIQHYVYALAALCHVRKLRAHDPKLDKSLPNIFDRYPEIKGADFEEIIYEFPFETAGNKELSAKDRTLSALSEVKDENNQVDPFSRTLTFPINIRLLLRDTEGCRQSGHEDEISKNVKAFLEEIYSESKKQRPNCSYCDYSKVCRYTCGGEKIGDDVTDEV